MPIVHAVARSNVSGIYMLEARAAFKEIANEVFAVDGRALGFNIFPTQFETQHINKSDLTCDIVFEVQLNANEVRILGDAPDVNGAAIAAYIMSRLIGTGLSIGVGLCHSVMGWASLDT